MAKGTEYRDVWGKFFFSLQRVVDAWNMLPGVVEEADMVVSGI